MADSNRHAAPEAIEAVALAGLSRRRLRVWNIVWVALPAILGVCALASVALFYKEPKLGPLNPSPVAVLLPIDADRADTPTDKIDAYLNEISAADSIKAGAIVANAKRLWQGFSDAFNAKQVRRVDQHHYYFAYPFKEDTTEKIMAQFETWYNTGVRTFVITISGAVVRIKDPFANWARTKPENDRPVMVATVASAPNIADRENGIFRYFIRSTEESSVLVNYIKSLNATEVGVFFIDDEYGRRAKDILDSLLRGDGITIRPFLIGLSDEETSIRTRVPAFIGKLNSGANAVAVIIGYGSMMKSMVENLEHPATGEGFRGKILIASTFTEESWRPSLDGVTDRIRTVGPGALDLNRSRRGVVYQFSYLTLIRALNCGNRRGREAIWKCWSGPSELVAVQDPANAVGADWARVEFTMDGDSVVTSLRLLNVAEN